MKFSIECDKLESEAIQAHLELPRLLTGNSDLVILLEALDCYNKKLLRERRVTVNGRDIVMENLRQ